MKLSIVILFLLGSLLVNLNILSNLLTLENTLTVENSRTSAWLLGNQATHSWEDHALVVADKMNCLYAGLENRVTLAGSGIPLSQLELVTKNPNVLIRPASKMGWGGSYIVVPKHGGTITLSGKDKLTGKVYDFDFRVLPSPKPIARLGRSTGKANMTSGEVRAQPGLYARVNLGDMEIRCSISSFSLNYQVKRRDPVLLESKSGRFEGDIKHCVKQAKPGDQYAFTDIYVRCGCDTISRLVDDIIVRIR